MNSMAIAARKRRKKGFPSGCPSAAEFVRDVHMGTTLTATRGFRERILSICLTGFVR